MASTAVAAIPAIIAAMQFLGGLFGSDQERLSFANQQFGGENLDPKAQLAQLLTQIRQYGNQAVDYASQPVRLRSSFVQQPPVFTGGGLPMPIGLTGVDPALADPTLLEVPGFDFSHTFNTTPVPVPPVGGSGGGGGGEEGPPSKKAPRQPSTLMAGTDAQRRVKKPSDAAAGREAIQFLL